MHVFVTNCKNFLVKKAEVDLHLKLNAAHRKWPSDKRTFR